jgi:hypothetical protein
MADQGGEIWSKKLLSKKERKTNCFHVEQLGWKQKLTKWQPDIKIFS